MFIGSVFALICLAAVWHGRWLVAHTPKGQGLARRLGEAKAVWLVRGVFAAGAVFGALLAADVIRPVQW